MHEHTLFFADLEVGERSSNQIPLSYFQTWACSQCKAVFHNTSFSLKVGRPSLQLTHLRKPVMLPLKRRACVCLRSPKESYQSLGALKHEPRFDARHLKSYVCSILRYQNWHVTRKEHTLI